MLVSPLQTSEITATPNSSARDKKLIDFDGPRNILLSSGYPPVFYSPPLGDPYYGATMVAIGVGLACDHYADTPAAQAGMDKLRRWFAAHPAPSLHHKVMLLWASLKTPGLMTAAERAQVISDVLALQRPDGGWALSTLGSWNRRDGSANDPKHASSDGYATAFVSYVLQKAGYSIKEKPVESAITWLKANQRVSGRWFTQSINTTAKGNLISNIGTAFAVMSLTVSAQERSRTIATH